MSKKYSWLLKIAVLSLLSALNCCIFIFPNKFAPSGIDGICTMIQDVLNINMGYLTLIVNIPLILIAFFKLNRQFAVNSTVYVIVFSISVIFIKELNIVKHLYLTNSALASVTSSCIRGIIYAFTLELNGSAGGIDIISAIIKKKKPYLDFMNNIFAINTFIAILSFWVYDKRTEPVILSIIYSFISSKVCNNIRYRKNENIKYEIITNNPEELLNHINNTLKQKATIIDAHGAFSRQNTKVILCIAQKSLSPFLEDYLIKHPDCITFKSYVNDSISGITYK